MHAYTHTHTHTHGQVTIDQERRWREAVKELGNNSQKLVSKYRYYIKSTTVSTFKNVCGIFSNVSRV